MAFDASKDKTLKEEKVCGDAEEIWIGLYQYNGGSKKIGITRRYERSGEQVITKLGRLSSQEAKALAPLLAAYAEEEHPTTE